ncbi:MAG: PhzF family phenazine biosynthesis protein [Candidatus Latescibacterota bacterium]
MGITIFQVDAFTDTPFHGNPAGVCLLTEPRDDGWMQAMAAEMNLAETAFLRKQEDGYALRWFTPLVEVELCGHATLASAHILWEAGFLSPREPARFHTLSGLLTAVRKEDEVELNFPQSPAEQVNAPPGLNEALGVTPLYVGCTRFDYLILASSEDEVRNLRPDFKRLLEFPVRGVIVTSAAESSPYDFISRFFAPRVGIDEDPVTGSAHCCLAPFWGKRLNKSEMTAFQASARGGVVKVRLDEGRVSLAGKAVTIFRAEMAVP